MIRAIVTAAAVSLGLAGAADAAVITVNATFDPGALAPFGLNVVAIAPVEIGTGDTLDMTVDFLGGPVTIGGGGIWFGVLTGDVEDDLDVSSTLSFTGNSANLPASIGPIFQTNSFLHVGSYFFDVAGGTGAFTFTTANMVTEVLASLFGTRTYATAFFYFESTIRGGDAPVIPEPATWAMMIAGFGLVGLAARRRREGALLAAGSGVCG